MIKVIAFDFGGVLGPDADDWHKTFKEIPKLTGLSEAKLQKLFLLHWPKLKVGREPMKKFWQAVSRESKNKIDSQELRWAYNNNIYIKDEYVKLIKKLKRKYKIILLANDSDDDYTVKTKKLKLDKIFDKLYCSSQLGIAKPGKEIFEFVLKNLKIKPQELLLVDNQQNNIKAAKSLKINSILFGDHA